MADFGNSLSITTAGSECLTLAQMGEKLTYTKIVLGDGNLPPGVEIPDVTALYGPKAEVVPTIIEQVKPGDESGDRRFATIKVGGVYSNSENLEGFDWRELGIYAKTESHEECLYGYGNAGENYERIPPSGGASLVEKAIDVHLIVTPLAEPHLAIDSAFLVTLDRMNQELDKLKKELGESGKAHEADQAAKLSEARTIQTDLESTEAVEFDGTQNVTPGIKGTLPVTSGGTGATTAEQARTNLGIKDAAEGQSGLMSAEDKKKLDSIDTDKLQQLGQIDLEKLKKFVKSLSSGEPTHVLLADGSSKEITALLQDNVETVRTALGVVTKETDGLVPKLPENPYVEEE